MKVADMHCDTLTEMEYRREQGENISLFSNDMQLDLERMKKGSYILQNFAIFTHLEKEKDPLGYCRKMIQVFYKEMEINKDVIAPARSYEDMIKNQKEGKMSAVLTIEEGAVCQGNIDILRELYDLGARMMTLTWNFRNCLGWPNKREEGTGKWNVSVLYGNQLSALPYLEKGHGSTTDTAARYSRKKNRGVSYR